MTDKVKHTPLPWVIDPLGLGTIGDVCDSEGNSIAQTQQRPNDNKHEERIANAQFIVTAANYHERLVEALWDAYEMARHDLWGNDPEARENSLSKIRNLLNELDTKKD